MTDKKTDKKVKAVLKEEELRKVTGGCNPDYVTGTYRPDEDEPTGSSRRDPKTNKLP